MHGASYDAQHYFSFLSRKKKILLSVLILDLIVSCWFLCDCVSPIFGPFPCSEMRIHGHWLSMYMLGKVGNVAPQYEERPILVIAQITEVVNMVLLC